MSDVQERSQPAAATAATDYDAVVIGAGIAGIYQLYRFRELGMRVRLFEAGSGVGGAWFWNRYPGARFDSESYSYGYSFSKELLEEWDWSEHFAPQPETLRYLNHVVDRFGLRGDIQLDSLVEAARFDEDATHWELTLADGSRHTARFVVAAVGPLTVPVLPRIDGVDRFKGEAYHTARWPDGPVSFEGKRVAVIGTGATGVQTIQEVAKTAGHLTVFQRTANYCLPLHNSRIDGETQRRIKEGYPEMFARCRATVGWFIHNPDPRSVFDVPEDERVAFFEQRYAEPGLGIWQGNFRDVLSDAKANEIVSEFVRDKIRQRVHDPVVAERLIPRNHGFGTRRVPLETRYYDAFNQPNVRLVDLKETPIERITETGIETTAGFHELDMIIYATGFDAITGSFDRIRITGTNGLELSGKWRDGPRSFLGVMASGFPNWFMPGGPLSALGNIPRALEYNVDWITDLIRFMGRRGLTYADARPEAEQAWTDHAHQVASTLLGTQVDSWMTGVNSNVAGRDKRVVAVYRGGAIVYRKRCEEVAASGYDELELR